MESWSWLCLSLSDGSWRVLTSICSVSLRMHKACFLTIRLCENSRSEAQRCYLSLVLAKLWHFPITARIVFSPSAAPMPIKEKILDERQRSWLKAKTWSWELILGMRKTSEGNTLKPQSLQHTIRITVSYYRFYAMWNGGIFFPHFGYPRNVNLLSYTDLNSHHCSIYGYCSAQGCQNPRENW